MSGPDPAEEFERYQQHFRNLMSGVTPEKLPRLLSIERKLWRRFQSAKPRLHDDSSEAALIVAWGWVAHTFRQLHAVARLSRSDIPECAMANARAAMEHGIYVSLLVELPQPTDVLDQLSDRFMAHFDRTVSTTDFVPQELLAVLTEVRAEIPTTLAQPTTTWTTKFKQICKRLTTGDMVYQHYGIISSQVHPGFGSAGAAIWDFVFNSGILSPRAASPPLPTAMWLALGASAWAGWSYDKLFHVDTFTPLMDELVRPEGFLPLSLLPEG